MRRPRFVFGLVLATAMALSLSPGTAGAHEGSISGFTSPLFGLDTAPNGSLLVADAGAGIVRIRNGNRSTVPLPGVTGVSAQGTRLVWASRGGGENPEEDSGQALVRVAGDRTRVVANLFAFEEEFDPDGQGVDSNPFDVQALSGSRALVVDAGGNDLLRVDKHGHTEVVATFPNEELPTDNIKQLFGCPAGPPDICGLPPTLPGQAVPTSVAIGPDGHYYVGELKGFPAPTGESRIWRIAPDATNATCGSSPDCELVFDGGFTSIIDLQFGPDGALYVAELDEASWATVDPFVVPVPQPTGGTINRCDLSAPTCTEVATDLDILTAITFAKDGTLWAAINALLPTAEVIAVT